MSKNTQAWICEWMTQWLDSWFLGLSLTEKLTISFHIPLLYFHQHFLSTNWLLLIKDLTYVHILNQTNPFSFCFDSLGEAGPHFTVLLMLCINNKINSRQFSKLLFLHLDRACYSTLGSSFFLDSTTHWCLLKIVTTNHPYAQISSEGIIFWSYLHWSGLAVSLRRQ